MAFDFAEVKRKTRGVVHATLGVSASYQDSSMSAPVPVRVRWHSKIDRFGDMENAGYAEVVEGIDRVIFEAAQARQLGVRHAGVVIIPQMGNAELTLDAMEPADGPFEEIWSASKSS